METLLKADIFFFITAVAVVLVTVAFLVMTWYAVRILRDVNEISMKAKDAAGKLETDLEDFRAEMKRKGKKVSSIADMMLTFISNLIPRRKKTEAKKGDMV